MNTGGEVVTLVPTIIPPSNTPAAPQTPDQPAPSQPPQAGNPGSLTTAVIIWTQTLLPGSTLTIGGLTSTLPNGQTTVVGGTQVVVGGSSTMNLPPPVQLTAPVVATIGTNVITTNAGGTFIIGTQTLSPGSVITVDGTTLSLASDASRLVVDGSTIPLPAAAQPTTRPAVLTLGDATITANAQSQFIVGGQTLAPGGPPITVDGTTLSLSPSATEVLINGTPVPISQLQLAEDPLLLTLGSQTITANPLSQFVLANGQKLLPGGTPITLSGTTLSLSPDASTVLVNGAPIPLSHARATTTEPLVITIGDKTLTADEQTWFTIGPQTLSFGGPALTVDGTTYYMTTDDLGSTVLVAGTAGPSLVVASATATTTMELFASAVTGTTDIAEESTTGGMATTMSKKGAGISNEADLWAIGVIAGTFVFAYGMS